MGKARDKAESVLNKYSIRTLPIPVEEIAQAEGAEIARHRFEGPESGFALRNGSRWIIGVNTQTSRRRQRFTIAHELGHLLLHEGRELTVDQAVLRIDLRDEVSSMATKVEEIEANAFAANILMPEDMILSSAARLMDENPSIVHSDLIVNLAREFDVSTEAMGFRLINLGILTA
ncbi:ImmA/IrrE family metallo-endopeptidase [Herbidospora sp. NEAU-GS84]|uniref:ImmA/IrrE family metallo-endopeptidase n=1 Tax=Herbidospora solisilvae TaxID=2696284 RepID=A0A7C9JT17_9ACTN|nr:ImmA/IrrE family metallo-endopeptidase [Herbidospora solisilvae]NAS22159.1 ImmA/IrrE family metallo-endopeptidase [Herbidospora solisilvae]